MSAVCGWRAAFLRALVWLCGLLWAAYALYGILRALVWFRRVWRTVITPWRPVVTVLKTHHSPSLSFRHAAEMHCCVIESGQVGGSMPHLGNVTPATFSSPFRLNVLGL